MNGEKNRMKEKKFTIVFLIQPLYGSLFVICINTKLRGSLGKPSIITLRRLQDIAGLGRKVKRSIWTGAKPGRASGYRGCWLSFSISIYHLNNTAPREGSLVLQHQNNWTCHYRIFDSNCGSGSKSWGEGGGGIRMCLQFKQILNLKCKIRMVQYLQFLYPKTIHVWKDGVTDIFKEYK